MLARLFFYDIIVFRYMYHSNTTNYRGHDVVDSYTCDKN